MLFTAVEQANRFCNILRVPLNAQWTIRSGVFKFTPAFRVRVRGCEPVWECYVRIPNMSGEIDYCGWHDIKDVYDSTIMIFIITHPEWIVRLDKEVENNECD